MQNQPELHPAIVSMVSLAAAIAARDPEMAACHLDRLRKAGIPEHQIRPVVELAQHIRDEAGSSLDTVLEGQAAPAPEVGEACCSADEGCCPPVDSRAEASPPEPMETPAVGGCCGDAGGGRGCC